MKEQQPKNIIDRIKDKVKTLTNKQWASTVPSGRLYRERLHREWTPADTARVEADMAEDWERIKAFAKQMEKNKKVPRESLQRKLD